MKIRFKKKKSDMAVLQWFFLSKVKCDFRMCCKFVLVKKYCSYFQNN